MPENRNSGTITKRKIMANDMSVVRVTDHASVAGANASPVSTAAGSVSITNGELTAPNAAITARKIPSS